MGSMRAECLQTANFDTPWLSPCRRALFLTRPVGFLFGEHLLPYVSSIPQE